MQPGLAERRKVREKRVANFATKGNISLGISDVQTLGDVRVDARLVVSTPVQAVWTPYQHAIF